MIGMKGIRQQLTLVFVILTIVPLLLVGLLLSLQIYQIQKDAAIVLQKEVAKRVINEMATVSAELTDHLQHLALISGLVGMDLENQRRILDQIAALGFRQQKNVFNDVSLLGPEGHELLKISRLRVADPKELHNYKDDTLFTVPVNEKRPFYGGLQISPVSRDIEMIVSVPLVEKRTGKIMAVLLVTARLDLFLETIMAEGGSHKISIFFADESGMVVSHEDPSVRLSVARITVPVDGQIIKGFDGQRSLRVTELFKFGLQPLYVICDYHVHDALGGVISSVAAVGFFIMVFLAVSLTVAYKLVAPIVGRIENLSDVALAIYEGNYGQKAAAEGDDEVSLLAKAMNAMTKRLVDDIDRRRRAEEALTAEITERIRMEKEHVGIKIKALAQDKLATLGEVATGVAHEINQPLSYVKIIQESALRDLTEGRFDQDEFLEECRGSLAQIARISVIIDHLRTFGREESLAMAEVNLADVWGNTLIIFNQRIRQKNVSIREDFGEDTTILGNSLKLEQLFINLLQNSLYALKPKGGGEIAIAVRKERDMVEVEFADTGMGISAGVLEKMYEPFFTTKAVGEGTGLGLAIVYGIIMDHQGTIDCCSQEGLSTVFTIRFPRYREYSGTGEMGLS